MDNTGLFIPDVFMRRDLIRKHYEKIGKISKDFDLDRLSYADKEECLFLAEQVALAIRQSLCKDYDREEAAHMTGHQPAGLPEGKMDPLTAENCVSMSAEQGLIRFWTPNMVLRSSAHSWYIATMAKANIRSYANRTGTDISALISMPAHIIIKRKARVSDSSQYADIYKYRDNENLEVSKLVNEICSCLGITDNAFTIGYTSVFEKVDSSDKEGTEIIIFSNDRLDDCYGFMSF